MNEVADGVFGGAEPIDNAVGDFDEPGDRMIGGSAGRRQTPIVFVSELGFADRGFQVLGRNGGGGGMERDQEKKQYHGRGHERAEAGAEILAVGDGFAVEAADRKSTSLNSSHLGI